MIYLLAIIFPPLAILIKGKPVSAILNFFLWCLGIIPGIIHAFLVINSSDAKHRSEKALSQSKKQHDQMMKVIKEHQNLKNIKENNTQNKNNL